VLHMTFNFPNDPKYWSDKYRRSLSQPSEWVAVARNLVQSMDCLRPAVVSFWKAAVDSPHTLQDQKYTHGVYLMLASYAMENLLKALLIREKAFGIEAFNRGLPDKLDTHDLVSLADSVGLVANDVVAELLTRMSSYAYWAGRYPAPTKEKFLKPTQITKSVTNIPTYWRGRDLRSIEVVLNHLYRRLGVEAPTRDGPIELDAPMERWEGGVLYEGLTAWA